MKERIRERKGKDEDIAKSLKLYDEEQHPSGECCQKTNAFIVSKFSLRF